MPRQQKPRVKGEGGSPASSSNRQSFDPNQPTDIHSRPVDYLTEAEVTRLVAGAKASRNPDRDTLLILMLFRHGLRESEALLLRRDWLKLDSAQIWVERLKGGRSSYHPLAGDEADHELVGLSPIQVTGHSMKLILHVFRALLATVKGDVQMAFLSSTAFLRHEDPALRKEKLSLKRSLIEAAEIALGLLGIFEAGNKSLQYFSGAVDGAVGEPWSGRGVAFLFALNHWKSVAHQGDGVFLSF